MAMRQWLVILALAGLMNAALAAGSGQGELHVLNWADFFIGPQAVDEFARAQNLHITYSLMESDDTLQAKLLTGHSGYDVVYPAITHLAQMIRAGVFQPIDWSRIPNRANLDPAILKRLATQDPGNRYGVPYVWGTSGIVINASKARAVLGAGQELDSWDLLFKPELASKLHQCGVSMVDQATDVLPVALAYLGRDPHSRDPADYREAFAMLRKIRPYIDQFESSYISTMVGGDVCVAFAWSGDAGMIKRRAAQNGLKDEFRYLTPRGQSGVWFQTMTIPRDAPDVDNAHKWINHMLEVGIAARITNAITYPTAVPAATKWVDPVLSADTGIFPPPEELKSFFLLSPMDPGILPLVTKMWLEFKAGR